MVKLGVAATAAVLLASVSTAVAAEITISCGTVGLQGHLCAEAVKAWEQQTGHKVTVHKAPTQSDHRYKEYLELLQRGDDSIDVFQVDVIWPAMLAEHFIDLSGFMKQKQIKKHIPALIENNTVDGRLIAMPWYTGAGLLYYRTDLLAKHKARVPETWEELTETALRIQTEERKAEGGEEIWGFVFQGEAYEGLTSNALEWVASSGGGSFVEADGSISANNPQAVRAIARAANWVGRISPPRSTIFREEDAQLTFVRGDAVFMRNWPYAWNLLDADPNSPVAGKVGVAPLPKDADQGRSVATLGGWQLAVSKHSKHPNVAASLVRHLTSDEIQKQRAIEGSYAPTIMSLYRDPEILRASPVFAILPSVLETVVTRPAHWTGGRYPEVSYWIWEHIHGALQGKFTAERAMASIEADLQKIKGDNGW